MRAADYLLPRPPLEPTREKLSAFEQAWRSRPADGRLDYRLVHPKWQFLSYLCEAHELVLHGSQNHGIGTVEARQALDARAFSSQRAIYATTDGIWVIFFAILDRLGHPEMSLFNSCLQAGVTADRLSDPLYFFSVTHLALVQQPWCEGTVYVLPRARFRREAPQRAQGHDVVFPHWICTEPVEPVARLRVGPQDFPFLDRVHGHDDHLLQRLAAADPNGFPWPEALTG